MQVSTHNLVTREKPPLNYEGVPPKVLPFRKVPIAIQDAVKEELDRLVNKGVLVPVTEPTKWVSQMAVEH